MRPKTADLWLKQKTREESTIIRQSQDEDVATFLYDKINEVKRQVNRVQLQNSFMRTNITKSAQEDKKLSKQINSWQYLKQFKRSQELGAMNNQFISRVCSNQRFQIVTLRAELQKLLLRKQELEVELSNSRQVNHQQQRDSELIALAKLSAATDDEQEWNEERVLLQKEMIEELKGQIRTLQKKRIFYQKKSQQIIEKLSSTKKIQQGKTKDAKVNQVAQQESHQLQASSYHKCLQDIAAAQEEISQFNFEIQESKKDYIHRRQEIQKQLRDIKLEISVLQKELIENSRERTHNESCNALVFHQ